MNNENTGNNNSRDTIFEEYTQQPGGIDHFLKQPKSWLIIFSIITAIVLVWYFYKSVILDSWNAEEVKKSIEIVWNDTKWVEKDVTPYDVKIVPTISFKIKNVGNRPLRYVNFEGVFEFEETGKVHTDGAAQAFKDEELAPGDVSGEIYIRAFFGYSAKSKDAFLRNRENWKKLRAKIFARTMGSPSVQLGGLFPIKQEIEGVNATAQGTTQPAASEDQIKSFQKVGKALQIVNYDSLWIDRARLKGKAVIVPSFTFQVKNVGPEALKDIVFKGEFLFEDTGEKLSMGTAEALKEPLPPGNTGKDITLTSGLGYEASSKEAFVHNNRTWRKVKVQVFAKHKDFQYVLLGTYPIRQEIEGVKVVYRQPVQ